MLYAESNWIFVMLLSAHCTHTHCTAQCIQFEKPCAVVVVFASMDYFGKSKHYRQHTNVN